MAQYSNVKLPAFFIPMGDYLHSRGNIEYKEDSLNDVHLLNPTKTHIIEMVDGEDITYQVKFKDHWNYSKMTDSDGYIYIFILGHNLEETGSHIEIGLINYTLGAIVTPSTRTEVINDASSGAPQYNGFSIFKAKFSGITKVTGFQIKVSNATMTSVTTLKLGCVSLCAKWNPPHNPDLSLTMTKEYDGVRTTTTKGGATLSDAAYTRGGTWWATSYPWELTGGDYEQGVNFAVESERTLGRRIWSMKFSYLTPESLMPKTESIENYETSLQSGVDDIEGSQSFFARVLNRVQGSHLPFIFLPNDTDPNNNPDQWAIVRFNQKDFSITQSAPELYSLSMKVRESW